MHISSWQNILNFIKKALYISLFCCLLTSTSSIYGQFYNGSQLTFGKNRVQYKSFLWSHYRYPDFDVYFYKNGKPLAIYTARTAYKIIREMEKNLDFYLESRVKFIVYNKLSELKQSNIGLISDEQYNTGGITHIVGAKINLYFDGNHYNYDKQIRAGIAQVMVNQILYGEQIGSMVKNSALMALPDWYTQGLISYLSEEWSTEIDNHVKDGIIRGDYNKINRLSGDEARYAGHAIWHYIAEKYGKHNIPTIVQMTRVSKNVENGFIYVLGTSLKSLSANMLQYYQNQYIALDSITSTTQRPHLLKKIKDETAYYQLKISPRNNYAIYVSNELGQSKVWLYNLLNNKKKKILKIGAKYAQKEDYTNPLLAWHPTGRVFSIIFEHKGAILLYYYTLSTKKLKQFDKIQLFHFEKVLSFQYSDDGRLLLMSAIKNGQSDIFLYDVVSHTYQQLTNDPYDDLQPCFINNSTEIVFSSNRQSETLRFINAEKGAEKSNAFDLFLYRYKTPGHTLLRITNTEFANEAMPISFKNNQILYLSDKNGINNRYLATIDSTISFVDTAIHYRYFAQSQALTNYSRSILEHHYSPALQKITEIIYTDGKKQMFTEDINLNMDANSKLPESNYIKGFLKAKTTKPIVADSIEKNKTEKPIRKKRFAAVYDDEEKDDTINKVDITNYKFDKNTGDKQGIIKLEGDSTQRKRNDIIKQKLRNNEFFITKQRNYNTEFNINQLISQLDFSYINTTYQPYTGGKSPIFINPGFTGFIKVGIADLFEDYRITGGIRLSGSLDNNEYIVSYENLKYRWDRQILFHRQSIDDVRDYAIVRHYSHELMYILKYPYSPVLAIRHTFGLRNDKAVHLSVNHRELKEPNSFKNWANYKAELIFDNIREKSTNIYYGTRFKIFAEYYLQIDNKLQDMYVTGFDIRNYQKIHRTFIWANRFAASTSFGKQLLIYYMGGVDNWITFRPDVFNTETPVAQDKNYTYQTLATNMRGFVQNARNGNSFFVYNTELRFPVFQYFINRPIRSDFVRNFQLVGFGDVGTAWTGKTPWSKNNSLFEKVIEQYPMKITVNNIKNPIVEGFGGGLRTRLLGYFIRTDLAWGVEDGYILPPVFYFSLCLDF